MKLSIHSYTSLFHFTWNEVCCLKAKQVDYNNIITKHNFKHVKVTYLHTYYVMHLFLKICMCAQSVVKSIVSLGMSNHLPSNLAWVQDLGYV